MTKLAETPEEYIDDLILAFSDLDEKKIKDHAKKYGMKTSNNPLVFWGSVYKAITGQTRFPMKLRQKAKKWLLNRDFTPWDDGDIPV